MGYGSRVRGRSSYCDFPLEILSVSDVGSGVNPDIDAIVALSPSLVVTTQPISQIDMFRMEQSGITTLIVPPGTNLNELQNVYRALGLVFEGAFTGETAGDEAFSAIARVCFNRDVVDIGSFVYITGDLNAATGDTLEHSIFESFGENIAEGGTDYSFDLALLSVNQPGLILLSSKYTIQDLEASEFFAELNAVRNGSVIYIDNTVFERPSAQIVPVVERMLEDFKNLGNMNTANTENTEE
jgi:iron complex transport system substrate-binding protein